MFKESLQKHLSINNQANNCVNCEKRCALFNVLSRDERQYLHQNKHEVKYKSREIILKQGTAMTHVVSFSAGLAKIYVEGYNNRDLILQIQKSTQVVAGPGMYVDSRHHFSMAALLDSTVCLIDINIFKELVRKNSNFMESFFSEMSQRSIATFEKFVNITQKQMHGRIADALIYLCEEVFCQNPFDMIISRQDLADMSGMSKESACRILKEFKSEGIISVKGNKIEILNDKLLKSISLNG